MLTLREVASPAPGESAAEAPGEPWDEWVAAHAAGHFLQSDAWARVRAAAGWRVLRLAAFDPSRAGAVPVAGIQVLVRRTPLGRFAYAPRGPVCVPDDPAWPLLLGGLRARLRGALALRFEPAWPDGPEARAAIAAAGLREVPAAQPPSTLVLDLDRSEEELLAGMAQKCRYNIRLAERRGVEVTPCADADLGELDRLVSATAERHGLGHRPPGYHAAVTRAFGPAATAYAARFAGRVVAMIVVVRFGAVATYLYGASSGEHAEHMPNHALQWHAIRAARRAGCLRYDFWGVPDALGRRVAAGGAPEDEPEGRGGLWGVWRFKRGFGGRVERVVGAWDVVLAPRRYALAFGLRARLARLRGRA